MRVLGEMELWRWGGLECVLVHGDNPRCLAVQVRGRGRILTTTPCDDPDCAAVEAERLYQVVSGEPIDERRIPQWLRAFQRRKKQPVTSTVIRPRGGER
jgi:hypothetical protein